MNSNSKNKRRTIIIIIIKMDYRAWPRLVWYLVNTESILVIIGKGSFITIPSSFFILMRFQYTCIQFRIKINIYVSFFSSFHSVSTSYCASCTHYMLKVSLPFNALVHTMFGKHFYVFLSQILFYIFAFSLMNLYNHIFCKTHPFI